MTGIKTNERPGTRAQYRYARMSPTKARAVLDLIRGKAIGEADEILAFSERSAAAVIRKVLDSAIANAEHNDEIAADELYVSACYADEGPTLKRWRPRARGRATRIRKRTSHITIIVSRLSEEEIARRRAIEEAIRESRSGQGAARAARSAKDAADARARRVAKSRDAKAASEAEKEAEVADEELVDTGAATEVNAEVDTQTTEVDAAPADAEVEAVAADTTDEAEANDEASSPEEAGDGEEKDQ